MGKTVVVLGSLAAPGHYLNHGGSKGRRYAQTHTYWRRTSATRSSADGRRSCRKSTSKNYDGVRSARRTRSARCSGFRGPDPLERGSVNRVCVWSGSIIEQRVASGDTRFRLAAGSARSRGRRWADGRDDLRGTAT